MINFLKRKVVTFGKKFLRLAIDYDEIDRMIQTNLSTMAMHRESFSQFKGVNEGKEVVVFATGPSSKKYKPIPGCIHIGVNHAYLRADINFDYYFVQDYAIGRKHLEEINWYRQGRCVKFYGIVSTYKDKFGNSIIIPEGDAIKARAFRYRTDYSAFKPWQCKFAFDISVQPLGDFGSVVFSALQFALWTHPRRIYLVGCDCTYAGHFFAKATQSMQNLKLGGYEEMVVAYKAFKQFAYDYYPDIEIVSINPVGLRGLYNDLTME